MGTQTTDIEGEIYDMAKGTLSFGGLNMTWDFTEGLSKEQWKKRRQIESGEMRVLESGRIIIPKCGIW